MKKTFGLLLILLGAFTTSFCADTIYIVGADGNNKPAYWTVLPSGTPSSFNELGVGSYTNGQADSVTFSPTQTVYILGQLSLVDTAGAEYWTISPAGSASNPNELATSDTVNVTANSMAFTPSGTGYIVGKNSSSVGGYYLGAGIGYPF